MFHLVLLIAVVAAGVSAQDQCILTMPTGPHVHHGDCCTAGAYLTYSSMFMSPTCLAKYPKPPRPTVMTATPDPAFKRFQTCHAECVFTENAMLTPELTLNPTAVAAKYVSSDATVNTALSAAVTKCLSTYAALIDATQECKSGAGEFNKCVEREIFLNCPTGMWQAIADCETLKTRTTQCPSLPVMMLKGGRGGGGGGRGRAMNNWG